MKNFDQLNHRSRLSELASALGVIIVITALSPALSFAQKSDSASQPPKKLVKTGTFTPGQIKRDPIRSGLRTEYTCDDGYVANNSYAAEQPPFDPKHCKYTSSDCVITVDLPIKDSMGGLLVAGPHNQPAAQPSETKSQCDGVIQSYVDSIGPVKYSIYFSPAHFDGILFDQVPGRSGDVCFKAYTVDATIKTEKLGSIDYQVSPPTTAKDILSDKQCKDYLNGKGPYAANSQPIEKRLQSVLEQESAALDMSDKSETARAAGSSKSASGVAKDVIVQASITYEGGNRAGEAY